VVELHKNLLAEVVMVAALHTYLLVRVLEDHTNLLTEVVELHKNLLAEVMVAAELHTYLLEQVVEVHTNL
jgi:hypothetical protein